MSREEYKNKSRMLAAPVKEPWDDGRAETINPEEEIKKAFTHMTNEQLEFHLQIPGKNQEYAKALLEHRKKKLI